MQASGSVTVIIYLAVCFMNIINVVLIMYVYIYILYLVVIFSWIVLADLTGKLFYVYPT